MSKLRDYLRLTKPGVMMGNVLTAVAGYLFASSLYGFNWFTFFVITIGMILVVGGACALNNYLDRDIDAKMTRTKTRPSVSGGLSPLGMQLFAWALFIVGIALLVFFTNWLTVAIGVAGFVIYVWLYGAWSKRLSIHGTAVGAISGALPIAGGYAAASGAVDWGIVIVFLIILFWQFPEFYSIAIYRKKEYANANVPVMPVVVGVKSTILQIFVYTTLYVVSTLLLVIFGYMGVVYCVVMLITGAYWVALALEGLYSKNPELWARRMFRFAMIEILVVCFMLSVGTLLP